MSKIINNILKTGTILTVYPIFLALIDTIVYGYFSGYEANGFTNALRYFAKNSIADCYRLYRKRRKNTGERKNNVKIRDEILQHILGI